MLSVAQDTQCQITGTVNNWVGYAKKHRVQNCYVARGTEKNKAKLIQDKPYPNEDLTRNILNATLFKFIKSV